MPAPVPIEIIHDNPSVLGRLALSAGQAQYQRRQHDDAVARDMDFLNREFDRRAQTDQDSMQYELAMNRLAADQDEGERAFALQNALAARRFGSASAPNAPRSTPFSRSVQTAKEQRAPFTEPAPGRGYISSDRGTTRFAGGQVAFNPDEAAADPGYGQELIDPQTGQIDFSKFPMSTQYTPGENEMRRGGSVVPTPQEMVSPDVRAQLDYIARLQGQIPPEQAAALQQLARTGQLKTQQLVNEVQQAIPKSQHAGLTTRDRELEIARLRRLAATTRGTTVRQRIEAEINRLSENMTDDPDLPPSFAPQIARSITSNPNPSPDGRRLTPDLAQRFMADANGDKELARQMAREAGFTF